MPTLTDLAHGLTPLTGVDVEWLHVLVSEWQLLSDLSFADLVLWIPLRDRLRLRLGRPDAAHDRIDGAV